MKKILSISIMSIFLMSCCDSKIKQTTFVISKTETITDSSHTFCKYEVKGDGHQLDIIDTIGKFKIGDTIVFQIRNTIDTNTVQ